MSELQGKTNLALPSLLGATPFQAYFSLPLAVGYLTIFIMAAFNCHTEEALLHAPQMGSGMLVISTRGTGAAGHSHSVEHSSILHKMTDLHPRASTLAATRSREDWIQASKEKHNGISASLIISTASILEDSNHIVIHSI